MNGMGRVQTMPQFDDFDFLVGPACRIQNEKNKGQKKGNRF
jgi:hypothetical protein